jgi:osmotically-inducible protein OsmY
LVEWQYQKSEAQAALKRLPGVLSIVNLIEVAPKATASDVRSKIEAAHRRTAVLETDRITVTVEDSKVTLDGTVHAWYERSLAEGAAWSAPCVKGVEHRSTLG